MRKVATIMAGMLVLAGCSGKSKDQAASDTPQARAYVPPETRPPTPVAGQAVTTPITAYVGKYPRDAVEGIGFFDRTDVANGLIQAVGDEKLRKLVRSGSGPQTPIFQTGTRVAAWGCEAHDCGDHNWTLLIDRKSGRTEVCHHDAATMGTGSRWYMGGAPVVRPDACPSQG